ncbi:major capsid protein [Wohlfahrtiimonas chitiniclastica]|uniref:major capsid protein n=1 Tax=Wohlfahrtiimonas chitiniclastica TaxID=400946 RepID=UPI0009ED9234|nr:major capsid protein [Wohlfahrtiimonas chitiniclastica]WHR54754.1 major capsid protein [Wohlfahrtiimonas chitiniclastica]
MQESKTISPKLNVPQAKFIALDKKFKAFVAGFGSGKTWVGCAGIAKHMWEYPKINAGYFAPTFPQIRDIFYQTMEEVAFHWGLSVDIKTSDKEVHFYNGATYRGVCICRSMDNPSSIVGFKIGHAMVDEIDILKQDKATLAWRKIIARMRYKVEGLRNGIDVTTTPEGFNFVYEQFVKSVRENPKLEALYGLVQASIYDNEKNLPDGYIESLYESYPKQLIEAYLNGRFVNLTSGTIYSNFDRKLNHSDAELKSGEPLHIGIDFNVLQMAAVVYVIRDGNHFDIIDDALTNQIYSESGVVIYGGVPGTLGKPVLVTDTIDPKLSFGLQRGAVRIRESQLPSFRLYDINDEENMAMGARAEGAFNIDILGYSYNKTKGENPNLEKLKAAASWKKYVASNKLTAGVLINLSKDEKSKPDGIGG